MIVLVPSLAALGQARRAYTVDRTLARAAIQAAELLFGEPREEWVLENCWRDLRVEDWEDVQELRRKLSGFLGGTDEAAVLSEAEYAVLEALLDCREALVEEEAAGTGARLERGAALVAIAGGIAALVGLLA